MQLISTRRTLPDKVRRLLIEEGGHRKEYVSAVTDRALQKWRSLSPAKAAWTSRRWRIPLKISTEFINPNQSDKA
jgi:hypothetical protein